MYIQNAYIKAYKESVSRVYIMMIECPICRGDWPELFLKNPCSNGHRVCLNCFSSMSRQPQNRITMKCPVCRDIIWRRDDSIQTDVEEDEEPIVIEESQHNDPEGLDTEWVPPIPNSPPMQSAVTTRARQQPEINREDSKQQEEKAEQRTEVVNIVTNITPGNRRRRGNTTTSTGRNSRRQRTDSSSSSSPSQTLVAVTLHEGCMVYILDTHTGLLTVATSDNVTEDLINSATKEVLQAIAKKSIRTWAF